MMKLIKTAMLAMLLVVPVSAWAGGGVPRAAAPVMGDGGLVALGIGLVGTGVAFLRKR